ARVRLPNPAQLARRYPHEISGGQQQRVAIAMAIAPGPSVLVLDEPTTALDVVTQAAVLALVNDLRAELNMAVLIVSHDLGVVSAVSDDVVVMRGGQEVERGATANVLSAPSQQYTQDSSRPPRAWTARAPRRSRCRPTSCSGWTRWGFVTPGAPGGPSRNVRSSTAICNPCTGSGRVCVEILLSPTTLRHTT